MPQKKDTGAKYQEHVISSGPYKFDQNNPGKGFTLVRNDEWDASTDEIRTALPDRIEVTVNANPDDIDNRLLSGDLDVDITGGGVQAAAQGRILNDDKLKAHADNAAVSRTWFSVLNSNVAPFDNIHCRKAVRVRGGQDRPAEGVRRPARRRHRDRPAAAADPGRGEVRPLRRGRQAEPATWTRPRPS